MLHGNCKVFWVLVLFLTSVASLLANERKRVFMFKKVTTIQTFSNRNNVGQPITTQRASLLSCAAHLMQYEPFTCMEYNTLQDGCRSNNGGETVDSLNSRMNAGWSFFNVQSIGNSNEECKMTDMGEEYRGRTNVTVTGKQCQSWGASTPHEPWHSYNATLAEQEGPGILLTNYCRYLNYTAPWCNTMDPNTRWEYCNVPKCMCYE